MAKLPVLWLKLGTRGGSNVRLGMSAPILAHPNETSDASEYIPARRYRTCIHHELRNGGETAFCAEWMRPLSKRDGSGFCYKYEDAT